MGFQMPVRNLPTSFGKFTNIAIKINRRSEYHNVNERFTNSEKVNQLLTICIENRESLTLILVIYYDTIKT